MQKYRGLIHGITVVVKEEGFAGVYRGLVPTIAKQMGNQSIRFSVYTHLKNVRGSDPCFVGRCNAGGGGGLCSLPSTALSCFPVYRCWR